MALAIPGTGRPHSDRQSRNNTQRRDSYPLDRMGQKVVENFGTLSSDVGTSWLKNINISCISDLAEGLG